jgi:O-succinylbenzoic acid--CoA ligase
MIEMPSLGAAAADPASAARIALVEGSAEQTYAELAARAGRARAALSAQGVGQGSRVALRARNDGATVAVIHAILDLGATLVPVHPRLTADEAADLIKHASPTLTLQDEDLGAVLACTNATPPLEPHAPELPLAQIYTSGTTGKPKGAVLSRRAFAASAAASAENLGWTPHDRWLLCMPVCHVGGLSILTRAVLARRTVILAPRFDPDAILASVRRDRATLLSVVPTMLAALLDRDRDNVLAGLRAMLVGGAAAPFGLLEECARRGVPALTTYGLTEACSQVAVQRLASPPRPARGSGHALPGVLLRVLDADLGVGRIQVRGPTLMDGYFAGPGHPLVRPFDADGFFDTGDLGEVDEHGTLHVHARRSDLIVTGGENVYPVEVEQRLESLAGVRRALVFGVPDERWGQIVAVALELAPGSEIEAVAVRAHAALAAHKRPRLACVVDALPLTSSGKLQRADAARIHGGALRPFRPDARAVLP